MNKNSTLGFLLIGAIFITWMFWMSPSKEEMARQKHVQDSIAQAQQVQESVNKIKTAEQQKNYSQAVPVKTQNGEGTANTQNVEKPTGVFRP